MITRTDTHEFLECCNAVIRYCNNPYAKSYAEAGLSLDQYVPCDDYTRAVQVQCLYILNNIQHWRGEIAQRTRSILKRLSKESN